MKFLVMCFLLAAGSCMAGVSSNDTYSSFYNSLPDDCKCFIILPVDDSPARKMCQYTVAGWLCIGNRASHFTCLLKEFKGVCVRTVVLHRRLRDRNAANPNYVGYLTY
jgi:hypothetical protein